MPVSREQFVDRLTQSGVLSADEVDSFVASSPVAAADVLALARALVQADKITKYQAAAIYQGNTKGLAFGPYVVLDELGAGGMGTVYQARHRHMDRIVAIKVMSEDALKDADLVERFYQEAKAAARLIHPNIVTAFDAGEADGLHYLVMEYVDGRDLSEVVHQHGPLPLEHAVDCVIQAARGLQYAHEQGVVHRDVKPGNLLLDRSGDVKVLDMGLARFHENELGDIAAPEKRQLTRSGQIMGTIDYMAPEQAEDTRRADHRADIYSLGCTLHRLLTGEALYTGETVLQRILAHRDDPIPALCQRRADASPALDAVFRKMVAKAPGERQQSMDDVIAELEAALSPAAPPLRRMREESSDQALSSFFSQLHEAQAAPTTNKAEETLGPQQNHKEVTGRPRGVNAMALQGGRSSVPADVSGARKRSYLPPTLAAGTLVLALGFLVGFAALVVWLSSDSNVDTAHGDSPPVESGNGGRRIPAGLDGASPNQPGTALPNGWTVSKPAKLAAPFDSLGGGAPVFVSADGLTVLVASRRPGGRGKSDLWQLTRADVAKSYTNAINLGSPVNSRAEELDGQLSADGLLIVFQSDRPGGHGATDLWMCERSAVDQPFDEAVNLGYGVNSKATETGPALSGDGLTLILHSSRANGRKDDLWMSQRAARDAPWPSPKNLVPPINSEVRDLSPSLSSDGLTLVFASDRTGGAGGDDLWMTTRTGTEESFGPPFNLTSAINTPGTEHPLLLTSGGRTLLFNRGRDNYQATITIGAMSRSND